MGYLPQMDANNKATRPTMDGYVRVSRVMGREGESYISPTVQREAIQRWADYKNVTISAWHVDEDQTGGTHERPGLEAAVERALNGETGGIVSWKIDRFSRHTEDGLRDLRRLEERNARLAFVVEDIDTSGSMGKFVYTIMLAMSTYFLDQIKASWVTAKTRAHERGAKIGPTPFGYRRVAAGLLEVHAGEAAILQEAYRIAARADMPAVVTYLQGASDRRTWTTTTARRTLALRMYLGEMRWGDLPPQVFEELRIVDRATWEAAQGDHAQKRRPARHYPLSGVASCGQCGEALVGGSAGKNQRTYRCRASLRSWKGERCAQPTNVTAALLEEHVRGALLDWADGQEWVQLQAPDIAEAEAATVAAERELDEFLADTQGAGLLRRVGRYETALAARVEAVELASATYRQVASEAAAGAGVNPTELLSGDDPGALATVARAGLSALTVRRGRGPLEDRVTLAHLPDPAMTTPQ